MAAPQESVSMALFCDFENVALGVRDAQYEKFDIKRVLERLLLKGSIVVKKAYCDWERYKGFKSTMHEANFELIEIPHVRQSGKNSADIRLVVDALDLCYTKSHVNTFVIISGDSDFSPLVSKLRENAKQVIGVGVKQSTSDLLIANCDEFIFYDDLVRESQRASARRDTRETQQPARRTPEEESRRKADLETRRGKAIEIAVETFDALVVERGDSGKIWASMLKEAIKRRKPDFSESYYGFRTFGNLLEEAQARGLLDVGRDEKSGTFVFRGAGVTTHPTIAPEAASTERSHGSPAAEQRPAGDAAPAKPENTRKRRGSRKAARPEADSTAASQTVPDAEPSLAPEATPVVEARPLPEVAPPAEATPDKPKADGATQAGEAKAPRARRGGRKSETKAEAPVTPTTPTSVPAVAPPTAAAADTKPARKPAARSRRPRKTDASPEKD